MRTLLLILIFASVGCRATAPAIRSSEFKENIGTSASPSRLEFDLKNRAGDMIVLNYSSGKIVVTEQVGGRKVVYGRVPSEGEWNAFWASLEQIQVWDWNSGVDPGDPAFWTLDMRHGAKVIHISGTHFQRGMNGDLSNSKEGWKILTGALQRLTGQESALLQDSAKIE